MEDITSEKLASVIARTLDDKLAKNIVILDINNISSLADYFVIASGDSTTQVRALTESVQDKIKKTFQKLPKGVERDLKNRWNLIDYCDVIVHVLHREEREAYQIEKFWNHAFQLPEAKWKEISKAYSDYAE